VGRAGSNPSRERNDLRRRSASIFRRRLRAGKHRRSILAAQLEELKAANSGKIFQEKISGARSDRKQLAKLMAVLAKGDVLVVTRLDRLARATRDLLNLLGTIGKKGAGFKSLRDTCADTKAASVQNTPRPRESSRSPRSSALFTRPGHLLRRPGSAAHLDRSDTPAMPGMHAPPHHVTAAIAIAGIVVGVGIVSVIIGPKAKSYKRTPVKSTVKSSTVESTASEASMEATAAKAASAKVTTVEATSATAVETAAAKAASVAAATTAASERHGWLNQADSRQCEQAYNRFPHHASFLGTKSRPRIKHFRTGIIRQSKSVRGKLTVSRG
jgi:Tfp pilus assembly major pilin PilA